MPTPERWAQITSVFHRALECGTGQREKFLDTACGADLSLRREVESLLAEHEREGVSLDLAMPALETVVDSPANDEGGDIGLIGQVIGGKYRIETLLGQGGMGSVYRARQLDLERMVAIKVVLAELMGNRQTLARFKHEAIAVGRLRHPNIVTVYDFGMDPEAGAYLVMEYLTGRSLREEVRAHGQLAVAGAVDVMLQVCSAVQAAHEAGVIHRDLKPDNIYLAGRSDRWVAKVLDFGVAKLVGGWETAGLTRAGAMVGTPTYMAPEQIEGERIDERADVYSLGCVLYEMLVGRPPFVARTLAAMTHKHLYEKVEAPGRVRVGVPEGLDRVVVRALAKRREERFATVAEMGKAVEKAGLGTGESIGLLTVSESAQAETVIHSLGRETGAPNNLPEQMTDFVGREEQVAGVKAALEGSRLVTLTGPGGIGKTRLALAVASGCPRTFENGIWLVELAGVRDAGQVMGAVATVLGVREKAGMGLLEAVVEAVREKRMLVVLDNCEHVIEASAAVVEAVLRAGAGVRVLATSQEVLGIAGEKVWAVPPLTMPANGGELTEEKALESEAVRLFVGHARLARPGFRLSGSGARAVGDLCRKLEGMPLAIELAAARVKLLTVEQILARMQDRFRLLTGGARTAPTRQQTLRAALDWSYELLTGDERTMLERLSVFGGGWNMEGAEEVCSGGEIDELAVLDLLTRLVDKSLVVVEERGAETRYRMLEMVREYGLARLEERGAGEDARRRHAGHFLSLGERAEMDLRTGRAVEWLDRFEAEYGNLLAALEWFLHHDPEACLRLSVSIQGFWRDRGRLSEARRWLAVALDRGGDVPPLLRARALRGAGEFARRQGDFEAASLYWEQSVSIARELGATEQLAWSSYGLGNLAMMKDDLGTARTCFQESLAAGRQIGNERLIADSLNGLGEIERQEGNWSAAREFYEQALVSSRRVGNQRGISIALGNLGAATCEVGDLDAARAYYLEALRMDVALGNTDDIAFALDGLAAVGAKRGEPKRAAILMGAAVALRRATGSELEPVDRAFHARLFATVSEELGESGIASAMAEGEALTLDRTIAFALEES